MLTVEWNPRNLPESRFLDLLNAAFGGGWDPETHRWYLAREFGGRKPDQLVFRRSSEPVAGTTINYRQLRTPDGRIVDVGIASASWTLPTERNRGHFVHMMEECASHIATEGCAMLLGFVTADNASCRGLLRMGAHAVASVYLISPKPDKKAIGDEDSIRQSDSSASDLYRGHCERVDTGRFHYPSASAFAAQFLDRPHTVQVLSIGESGRAVIEEIEDTDRLQWLSVASADRADAVAALVVRAARRGRRFFTFGTGAWAGDCATRLALEQRPGAMMFLPAATSAPDCAALARLPWDVFSGDRM